MFSPQLIDSSRIALQVEYDGAKFHGWQMQRNPPQLTVQETLEQALSYVANKPIKVQCAGRTDAGVHATGQVVHFETDVRRTEVSWVKGVNTQLPDAIVVKWARAVPEDFHARFSATARTYRYLIANQPVRVVIEAVRKPMTRAEWGAFVRSMAGSISDPTFERPPQLPLEARESLS